MPMRGLGGYKPFFRQVRLAPTRPCAAGQGCGGLTRERLTALLSTAAEPVEHAALATVCRQRLVPPTPHKLDGHVFNAAMLHRGSPRVDGRLCRMRVGVGVGVGGEARAACLALPAPWDRGLHRNPAGHAASLPGAAIRDSSSSSPSSPGAGRWAAVGPSQPSRCPWRPPCQGGSHGEYAGCGQSFAARQEVSCTAPACGCQAATPHRNISARLHPCQQVCIGGICRRRSPEGHAEAVHIGKHVGGGATVHKVVAVCGRDMTQGRQQCGRHMTQGRQQCDKAELVSRSLISHSAALCANQPEPALTQVGVQASCLGHGGCHSPTSANGLLIKPMRVSASHCVAGGCPGQGRQAGSSCRPAAPRGQAAQRGHSPLLHGCGVCDALQRPVGTKQGAQHGAQPALRCACLRCHACCGSPHRGGVLTKGKLVPASNGQLGGAADLQAPGTAPRCCHDGRHSSLLAAAGIGAHDAADRVWVWVPQLLSVVAPLVPLPQACPQPADRAVLLVPRLAKETPHSTATRACMLLGSPPPPAHPAHPAQPAHPTKPPAKAQDRACWLPSPVSYSSSSPRGM